MTVVVPRAVATALLLVAAPAASAHEVRHRVERGSAVAVHASFAGGQDLAFAPWEAFSPSDPGVPHQRGRTDRRGWLAFVPDAPGRWRVRVVESGGHGLDVEIDVPASAAPSGPAPADPAAPSTLALVLRPAGGVLAVGAVFAALLALRRRRASRPGAAAREAD